MRLIRLTKPEIQYDSRLTTLVLISPVNFAFLISPCHFHFLFDLFISSFNFHPFLNSALQFHLAFSAFLPHFLFLFSKTYSFPPFYIIFIFKYILDGTHLDVYTIQQYCIVLTRQTNDTSSRLYLHPTTLAHCRTTGRSRNLPH